MFTLSHLGLIASKHTQNQGAKVSRLSNEYRCFFFVLNVWHKIYGKVVSGTIYHNSSHCGAPPAGTNRAIFFLELGEAVKNRSTHGG